MIYLRLVSAELDALSSHEVTISRRDIGPIGVCTETAHHEGSTDPNSNLFSVRRHGVLPLIRNGCECDAKVEAHIGPYTS